MNAKKQIEYVNPKTGEVFTGTAEEICKKFKISNVTMYKHLKQQTLSTVNTPINSSNDHEIQDIQESEIPNTQQNQPTPTVNPPVNSSKPLKTKGKVENKYANSQAEDNDQLKYHPESEEPTDKLPQKPCVICGKKVFHTKMIEDELVHICFASCKSIYKKPERRPPSKEQMAYLLKYIADNTKLKTNIKRGVEVE